MAFLDYNGLTRVVNKLKALINAKANAIHTHSPNDVVETTAKQFISKAEKDKVAVINVTGDGTEFLSNDGAYKPANSSILITNGDGSQYLANDGAYKPIAISAVIDDDIPSTESTYSSQKIEDGFVNVEDWHTHNNKEFLDDITEERFTKWEERTNVIKGTGDGTKFLADDYNYKEINVSGGGNSIDDSNETSTNTTFSASKINSNISTAVGNLNTSVNQALNQKVDAVVGKGLSTNDYSTPEKNKVALLKTDGSPQEFHAKDGNYYKIDNVGIDDENPSDITTYSGNNIEKRLNNSILNLILPTQNDAPTMWKKTFENVSANDVLEMQTSLNFNINNAIIQVYKYIAGNENQTKTISDFNSSEAKDYIYNPDNVEFSGQVKIKDNYSIPVSLNDQGFYETQIISKSDYADINNFNIMAR